MEVLPEHIVFRCLFYLPLYTQFCINKVYFKRVVESEFYRRKFLTYWFPSHILDALGGLDKCVNEYPLFKIHPSMVGPTEYIDNVKLSHLPLSTSKHPPHAYFSVDLYKRPVVILRYWSMTSDESMLSNDEHSYDEDIIDNTFHSYVRAKRKYAKTPKEVAVALFQRYSDSPRVWSLGTCYGLESMPGDNRVTDDTLVKIKCLMDGKAVRVGYSGWLELRLMPRGKEHETIVNQR